MLAAVELAAEGPPKSPAAAERAIRAAIGRVAEALGNTPAVCRSSYVDPCLLDRFRDGHTVSPAGPAGERGPRVQHRIEREVLELLSS